MKLLRLKITDPKGFRSLQAGFEYQFRSEWILQEEEALQQPLPFTTPHFGILRPNVKSAPPFAPFVCAGPNGSGKSNLLEALAAIFYHMESIYLENRPDSFSYEENTNPDGFRSDKAIPDGFEIEYLIRPKDANNSLKVKGHGGQAHIKIVKQIGETPKWILKNNKEKEGEVELTIDQTLARQLLPDYILGYSSGDNEILSLPFFKMRFIQYDEYWQALTQQLPYSGRPESRLVYLDSSFSQAILLCNLLFQAPSAMKIFNEDVGIEELIEFRIIIRRSFEIDEGQISTFGSQEENKRQSTEEIIKKHPALMPIEVDQSSKRCRVNLVDLLDGDEKSDKIIACLKRCATCWFEDEETDSIYLDYYVNEATRQAFRENFYFEINSSPIALFQAFQVLLTLNLYSVSDRLKADLYQSDSLYVSETVPTLASDERIMRFKNFWMSKKEIEEPILLKSLSDGEHQLMHSLGLCLLFKNTNSLFLLDEPETHFNPDWRSNFISRLYQCFKGSDNEHEMLVTTHAPFLISDSRPEKVLVFNKDKKTNEISVSRPEYNTLGASINKITMSTFGKRETIGGYAQKILENMQSRFENGEDKVQLIKEINNQLGDSVEKVLLIKTILDSMEEKA